MFITYAYIKFINQMRCTKHTNEFRHGIECSGYNPKMNGFAQIIWCGRNCLSMNRLPNEYFSYAMRACNVHSNEMKKELSLHKFLIFR